MHVEVIHRLKDVEPQAWDALVGEDNPFVEHAFLALLETSGSVGENAGWMPAHVLVWDGKRLVGAAPAYLKDHSYGEYIFDWSWADAAHRLGLPYYPKVVVAVPFTPATGPRLLVHPDAQREQVWLMLVEGLKALIKKIGAWSFHILFCLDEEAEFLERHGLIRRATHQFHWRNDGYDDFEGLLSSMRSRARKQIRKERRKVQELDVSIEMLRGDQASLEDWEMMYRLYTSTTSRKWGDPYLTRAFFRGAAQTVGTRAILLFARHDGKVRAGTLSFAKGDHIYGRYWGAFEQYDGLHFELCYYQLIEHAINNGCLLVEAGAQGAHKVKRGFLPVITHSAHHFAISELGDALKVLMRQERMEMQCEIEAAQKDGPFREDALPDLPASAGLPLADLLRKNRP